MMLICARRKDESGMNESIERFIFCTHLHTRLAVQHVEAPCALCFADSFCLGPGL